MLLLPLHVGGLGTRRLRQKQQQHLPSPLQVLLHHMLLLTPLGPSPQLRRGSRVLLQPLMWLPPLLQQPTLLPPALPLMPTPVLLLLELLWPLMPSLLLIPQPHVLLQRLRWLAGRGRPLQHSLLCWQVLVASPLRHPTLLPALPLLLRL